MRVLLLSLLTSVTLVAGCDLPLGGGGECAEDSDCSGSDICDNGECVECEDDRDCDDDEECNGGECEAAEGEGEGDAGEGEGEGEGEGGVSCSPDTFAASCSGDVITLCDPANNTTVDINCSTEFYTSGGQPLVDPTLSCVEPAFSGSPAPGALAQCWGEAVGATCLGTVSLMVNGTDGLLIGCAAGLSCELGDNGGLGESCQPATTTCSTAGDVSCVGNTLALCALGGDGFVFSDPFTIDCAAIGGACLTDRCSGGTGALCSTDGFAAVCDPGLTCTPDAAQPGIGSCG